MLEYQDRDKRADNRFIQCKGERTRSLIKGLAKLGNIVAGTLLRRQMFPNLAARETYVAETILLLGNKKMFLPQVKNIFATRTQILLPKHMFPSLDTMKAMLTSFQCCSLKMFPSNKVSLLLCASMTLSFLKQFFLV